MLSRSMLGQSFLGRSIRGQGSGRGVLARLCFVDHLFDSTPRRSCPVRPDVGPLQHHHKQISHRHAHQQVHRVGVVLAGRRNSSPECATAREAAPLVDRPNGVVVSASRPTLGRWN
jgi:hypothetical protein